VVSRYLEEVTRLVAAHGADPDAVRAALYYLLDRTAGLSVATVHSSPHSSPHGDPFLTGRLGLSRRQVGALLSLLRGSRPIRRGGRTIGGLPGMVAVLAAGTMTDADLRRFTRLARIAAGHPPARRGEQGVRLHHGCAPSQHERQQIPHPVRGRDRDDHSGDDPRRAAGQWQPSAAPERRTRPA
jgi:hypothetical protein